MTALLVALALCAPDVRYAVHVEARSWQPLEPKEVEALLEQAALPVLTRSGAMKLQKSGFADLKNGDYSLLIEGRFIEEAEQFSVYLTFGPGKLAEVPSFYATDTIAIGRRPPAEMQKVARTLAQATAVNLITVLEPRLLSAFTPIDTQPGLPLDWGAIAVPTIQAPTQAVRELLDIRLDDNTRLRALADLAPHLYDQPAAEHAAELCLLRDPSPDVRVRCAQALAPVARTRLPAQRLILAALRQELDDKVIRALTELAQNFAGLSRKEAIATYLELMASEATPGEASAAIAELLASEGDVPNLDLTVAKCLSQPALAYGKKVACADHLLRVIPEARRMPVVWKYLQSVQAHEQGELNVFDEVYRDTVGHASGPLPREVAELFLSVAQRPSADFARANALDAVRRYPKPGADVFTRLFAIATDSRIGWMAIRSISELARAAPEQTPFVISSAKQVLATQPLFHRAHTPDPREELSSLVKNLER
jgi:hypothetical protein